MEENAESLGRLWTGRVRWEFPSSSSATSAEAYAAQNHVGGSSGDSVQCFPFISSFSTAGGTKHMTTSLATRSYAVGGTTEDDGGGIDWDGERFVGVDVPCPSINFGAYLNRVLPYVGKVNAKRFFGRHPGTVLFNGITSGFLKTAQTADGVKYSYWETTFNFPTSLYPKTRSST